MPVGAVSAIVGETEARKESDLATMLCKDAFFSAPFCDTFLARLE